MFLILGARLSNSFCLLDADTCTVHSLATLIARTFPGVKLRLVAPPQLGLPQYVKDAISESSASICEHEDLDPVVSTSDVIYMTRVQKERFSDLEEYQRFKLNYVVTPDTMAKAKDDMVLMHPLPRVGEIDPAVDSDFRSAFFRQVTICHMNFRIAICRFERSILTIAPQKQKYTINMQKILKMENGMYVRMALLALVMGAQGLPLNASKPIIEELVA